MRFPGYCACGYPMVTHADIMIELESIDRDLLDGRFGPAAARAMSLLVRYGSAIGATRFISITAAHIDGAQRRPRR
jgi:predicted aconitase